MHLRTAVYTTYIARETAGNDLYVMVLHTVSCPYCLYPEIPTLAGETAERDCVECGGCCTTLAFTPAFDPRRRKFSVRPPPFPHSALNSFV